jgi:hypothetical protein
MSASPSIRDVLAARPHALWRMPGEMCPLSSPEALGSLPSRVLDMQAVRIGEAVFAPVDLPAAEAAPIVVLVEDDDDDRSLARVLQSFDVERFVNTSGEVARVDSLLAGLTLRQLSAPVECSLARFADLERLVVADEAGRVLFVALEEEDGAREARAVAAALRGGAGCAHSESGGSAWESNPPGNASVRPHDRFEDGAPHRRSRTPASV